MVAIDAANGKRRRSPSVVAALASCLCLAAVGLTASAAASPPRSIRLSAVADPTCHRDGAAAIQAAFDAYDDVVVDGCFLVSRPLMVRDKSFSLTGLERENAGLVWTARGGLIYRARTIQNRLVISNLVLSTRIANGGFCLTASWPVTPSWTEKTFTSRDLSCLPATGYENKAYFTACIDLSFAWNGMLDGATCRGRDNTQEMKDQIILRGRTDDFYISNYHGYFSEVGVVLVDAIVGDTVYSPEGTHFTDATILAVDTCVQAIANVSAPYLVSSNFHCASRSQGFVLTNKPQSSFAGTLIYSLSSGRPFAGFQINQGSDQVELAGVQCVKIGVGRGDQTCINLNAGERALVHDGMSQGFDQMISFGAATCAIIHDNRTDSGSPIRGLLDFCSQAHDNH